MLHSPTRTEPARRVMVQPHMMTTRNTKRPSVPGSRKAEGAKNHRVPRTQLCICTCNVRTLKDQEKEEELEHELERASFKWDILGLAETRKKGEQLEELQSGHMLYTKGGEESIRGVSFLVNKKDTRSCIGIRRNK